MFRVEGDRRQNQRVPFQRPCKLYEPRCGRYIAASTCDVSASGLLLDVPRLLPCKPGEKLHLGVATKRRQGLLLSSEMLEVVVVRSMSTVDDHTILAVRFEAQQSTAEPVAVRTAA